MTIQGSMDKRILLVEPDPSFMALLKLGLQDMGFAVTVEQTIAGASARLRRDTFHFCVFALHVDTVDVDDPDGLALVKTYRDSSPPNYYNGWVILTSEDDYSPAVNAVRRFCDGHLFAKDDRDRLFRQLKEAFENFTPQDWLLDITDSLPRAVALTDSSSGRSAPLAGPLDDILRQLFGGEGRIAVCPLADQGYSDTLLLSVVPPRRVTSPRWSVVKVGFSDDIHDEERRILEHVRPTDLAELGRFVRSAEAHADGVAALMFDLVSEAKQLSCLYKEDEKRAASMLRKTVEVLDTAWYCHSRTTLGELGGGRLLSPFADERDIWQDRLRQSFPELEGDPANDERLYWRSAGVELILVNPFQAIPPEDDAQQPFVTSTIHGDLHTRNVLVCPRNGPVPIDFAHTDADQPIYVDFAKLESHIVADLLEKPDHLSNNELLMLLGFLRQCLCVPDFVAASAGDVEIDSAHYMRAWVFISTTRKGLSRRLKTSIETVKERWDQQKAAQWQIYRYALLAQYMKAWKWLAGATPMARAKNLLCCSVAAENCASRFAGMTQVI